MYSFAEMIQNAINTLDELGPGEFWLPFGTLMHIAAFLFVAIHCLYYRRESVSAILWIFVAWSFPIVGPFLFLVFGINKAYEKGWRKQRSDYEFLKERRAREESAMPLVYWRAVHESLAAEPDYPDVKAFNSGMNMLSDYPLLKGNSIEPLVDGDETFPAMIENIRNACKHIHVQTFIVGNDEVGRTILDELKKKAMDGVRVRFLFDGFGSAHAVFGGLIRRYEDVPGMSVAPWTQANPLKRRFQINLRNHRKIMIIDGKSAFIGGINFSDENTTCERGDPIRDYHFRVHGPIVQELQYSFLRDWYFATDEHAEDLLKEEHFPHISSEGDSLIRLVSGGPTDEVENMTDVFFNSIVAAEKQLLVVTPYFVPPMDILRAFRSAALRGVNVRLVVPLMNNHFYAGLAGQSFYEDLLSAGVRIFQRRPPFIHAKALIVDDKFAVIGTSNLDVRSLRLNYETNLAVFDEVFAGRLKRLIIDEIALSDELELTAWEKRPTHRQLLENFCGLLTPIL